MMNATDKTALSALIRAHRQAALAVLVDDAPLTAMVAYAELPDLSGLLVLLSSLSAHKRALLANPVCSLLICEPDDGAGDVMTRARVSLQGRAHLIARDAGDFAAARDCYLAKLPAGRLWPGADDCAMVGHGCVEPRAGCPTCGGSLGPRLHPPLKRLATKYGDS
jgi:putative heme iron utilization protein